MRLFARLRVFKCLCVCIRECSSYIHVWVWIVYGRKRQVQWEIEREKDRQTQCGSERERDCITIILTKARKNTRNKRRNLSRLLSKKKNEMQKVKKFKTCILPESERRIHFPAYFQVSEPQEKMQKVAMCKSFAKKFKNSHFVGQSFLMMLVKDIFFNFLKC